MNYKYDHVHLVVKDVEGMCTFLERMFDARRVNYKPDVAGAPMTEIFIGEVRLLIIGHRPNATIQPMAEGAMRLIDHFGFEVDDLDVTVKQLKERGGVFSVEPRPAAYDGRVVCFLTAPENLQIEIAASRSA